LRIAILTTSYPERAGDPAGHFIESEALHRARQGHDVHVVAPGRRGPSGVKTSKHGSGRLTIWNAGGGSLFGLPGALVRAREKPHRLLRLAEFLPAVRFRLARLAPLDAIVAHFIVPCGYPLSLGGPDDIEVVLHGSDVRVMLAMPNWLRSHIVGALLDRGARFRFVAEDLRVKLLAVLPSRQSAELGDLARVELPRISVAHVIRSAPSKPRTSSTTLAARAEDGVRRWVVCARLVPSKRVDLAIREAARHRAALTVIGDGPLRAELEALASGFEPRARFTGQLPRGDALALIADAHKLVHLSEAEGAPTVIREARALGVPVLATPVGDVARWAAKDPGIEIFRPEPD
jgi:teichuronic acid biosynthesis glycosyltransferase TuaC